MVLRGTMLNRKISGSNRAGFGEVGASTDVAQHFAKSIRERWHTLVGDKIAESPLLQYLTKPANVCSDNRYTLRHRFHCHQAK
jgi:hypothetical protein